MVEVGDLQCERGGPSFVVCTEAHIRILALRESHVRDAATSCGDCRHVAAARRHPGNGSLKRPLLY